ncbi:hypothetical protein BB934_00105 [Microvirga ossetica]|uniref:Uncharacterized protein n=1 Tax=Microvirga ossetica TaxID=1882682 RepID=A0A1B2EA63_9HYPH|nr:hypothetical protein [Microvirga ossetica]ANY76817.1 hypothetical protein BB934_00105 [Microvirga ossetica]
MADSVRQGLILRGEGGRFLPGSASRGRPKGSRSRLARAFVDDAYAVWQEHGKAALETLAREDPGMFVRIMAGITLHSLSRAKPTVPDEGEDGGP